MPPAKEKACFIEPMLLVRAERLPEGVGWAYELLCCAQHNISSVALGVMWRSSGNALRHGVVVQMDAHNVAAEPSHYSPPDCDPSARAGIDIITIPPRLGRVSLNITNVYADVDLEMKAKALAAA
jgi:hypothetical protein